MKKKAPDGLILLHKQPGITSFDSLRDIKRALGTGKAGHTGTLDKFAEGLLLVLTGRALKLSQWFTHCDKQYEGIICFGDETETLDPEGTVIASAPLPSRKQVEAALVQFRGEILQAPPAYSAIHVGGERASELARRGESPEMQKRPVTIYALELRSWEPPFANIFVHCSSGTYIRSLARDIALATGSRAHLTKLVRTKVAGFSLEDAGVLWGVSPAEGGGGKALSKPLACDGFETRGYPPPRLKAEVPLWKTSPLLLPINKSVFEKLAIPCLEISPENAQKAAQGKPLAQILSGVSLPPQSALALFSGGAFIAIIKRQNDKWSYGYVFANNELG